MSEENIVIKTNDETQTADEVSKPELSPEQLIRRSRGAQLRALVLSWHLNEIYQNTLQIQATELQKGDMEISDDWGEIANDILHQFESQVDPNRPKLIL